MIDMMDTARLQIDELMRSAYAKAAEKGTLPEGKTLIGAAEVPRDRQNGDFAATHAMAGAKEFRMAPKAIASALLEELDLEGSYFDSAVVAGPGFINFTFGSRWYEEVLAAIEKYGDDYGRSDVGHGEKVMVEFVSANPTGPMTIGNARGGVLGDTLASVLDMAGYNVWREFYVNDAGNQVDLFGRSIEARYLQICLGEDAVEFPDNGYHGDDIKDLARMIYEKDGDRYVSVPSEEPITNRY